MDLREVWQWADQNETANDAALLKGEEGKGLGVDEAGIPDLILEGNFSVVSR